ncbi:protein POST-ILLUMINATION CHLOROPHYLL FLUORESCENCE INCREASE, chloroplastic-like isoform X2 [Primulina eburnea]|uniref:protein POST-ILLUMINATION CHLOROPHYLL FLUORESCENCE INCREASE, chloroplastic-like isoform X2 n=1 Tax=Primulina eburnea TaxID=1245227 RepID=UPI003C6C5377
MAATAATSASLFNSSKQIVSTSSTSSATSFWWSSLPLNYPIKRRLTKIRGEAAAVAAALVADAPVAEFKEWADFDLGRAPVYWKTMNGLPLRRGFNHPIMCDSEPRVMLQKVRKSRSSFLHHPNMPLRAWV